MGAEAIGRAMAALAAAAEAQAAWHGAPLHFTRQRGDGWQVALVRADLALRSALGFRAALRSLGADRASYIAAAEGDGPDLATVSGDLNGRNEMVFVEAGRALDALKAPEKNQSDQSLAHAAGGAAGAAFALADHISRGWTAAQAATIAPFLAPGRPPTQTEVARALGKSRQSVAKALDGAGYEAIRAALAAIETGDDAQNDAQKETAA